MIKAKERELVRGITCSLFDPSNERGNTIPSIPMTRDAACQVDLINL